MYTIYKHTSPSGKSYIGQTKHYDRRVLEHKIPSSRCVVFKKAIQKYGWNNFTHEILFDNLTLDESNSLEEWCIRKHNTLAPNGYNLQYGGNNRTMLEVTKQKISDIRTGVLKEEHIKQKISKTTIGKPKTKEHAENISKGKTGKSHTEETKQKIKNTLLKRKAFLREDLVLP